MLFDSHMGRHEFPVDIHEVIQKTKETYYELLERDSERYSKYVITLMELLKNSLGYFSARRATMLEDSLLYVVAASIVLSEHNDTKADFQEAAYLHIQNTIPNIANRQIDKTLLLSICNQALKLSHLEDTPEKRILIIHDPIERLKELIRYKNDVSIEIANDAIPSSLSEISYDKYRRAMALFTYLAFRTNRNIHAAVMETLATEIRPILETKSHSSLQHLRTKKIADTVTAQLNTVKRSENYKRYLNNYLCSYLPNDYKSEDEVKQIFTFFVNTWKELKL